MPQRLVWKNKHNNASLGNNNNNTNRRMTPAKAGSCGDCLLEGALTIIEKISRCSKLIAYMNNQNFLFFIQHNNF